MEFDFSRMLGRTDSEILTPNKGKCNVDCRFRFKHLENHENFCTEGK